MHQALDNLEKFLYASGYPVLVQAGLLHAQFEAIHPFLDGNGRVGRLLITFFLCQRGVLRKPLLYLSRYLMAHRNEYYARLTGVHDQGDWEAWIEYFLRGVHETSLEATETTHAVLKMYAEHRELVGSKIKSHPALVLVDFLFRQPILSVAMVERHLDCARETARKLVNQFAELGLLEETTGYQRNRRFRYSAYLALFELKKQEAGA